MAACSVPLTTATRGNLFPVSDTTRRTTGRCSMIDYTSPEAKGFARWNEEGLPFPWEYRIVGLPSDSDGYLDYAPSLTSLAVNRGRLFAGLYDHGVYMFDARSDTWIPAGLQWLTVSALVSHQSELYAAVDDKGIYRASIPIVHSYGKSATTWGAKKQKQ